MKITIAKTAGFCMGVRRAVELALDAPNQHPGPIFTYGPLIHNPQVLSLLNERGITAIEDVPEKGSGTILVRAHGVPPEIRKQLFDAGFKVIDATCPRVIKVQTIIRKHTRKGFVSIILGDRNHPEVVGLLGFAGKRGVVVSTLEELKSLPAYEQAIIVAQTTQNTRFYDQVKEWALSVHPHYKIFDTICDSTERRQEEVKRLASDIDVLVVVGGHDSGNTRRLAGIGNQAGIPTYHVETEDELDLKAISEAEAIGIMAGASTPNWIIRRVYRTLETLPFKRTRVGLRALFSLQRKLLLTNIYISLGAGCLSYAFMHLMKLPGSLSHILIAMLYVLSMHILNNLTGRKADFYNDPDRAQFYEKHIVLLTVLALLSGSAGLLIALIMGPWSFMVLLIMSLLGLSYNLKILPDRTPWIRYRRIKEVPGSKTVLIALAWGVVTVLFPALSISGRLEWIFLPVFLLSSCIVFVRTAFYDILDMQGDRIVGRETLPLLLGEQRTLRLLKALLLAIFASLILLGAVQGIAGLGLLLAVCPVLMFIVIRAQEQGRIVPGVRMEFLVDTHFILTGVLALFWSAMA